MIISTRRKEVESPSKQLSNGKLRQRVMEKQRSWELVPKWWNSHKLQISRRCLKAGERSDSELRGLKAWFQYFCHVFWPYPCLLLDMKTQVRVQRIYLICQPHPSTCSLTIPRPHPLLPYRRGRVLPSFSKHPRKFKAEVLATVLSHWILCITVQTSNFCGYGSHS